MWFFTSPQIVYGEDALSYLEQIQGTKALIVTDPTLHQLGLTAKVEAPLHAAGMETAIFAEVEPEPSLQTVLRGAKVAQDYGPDLIIGLGGGSPMDAAKAIAVLYEDPEINLEELAPWAPLTFTKCKLIAIPTTAGTGSETTWAIVLTDTESKRKLSTGHRAMVPFLAVLDPILTQFLPPRITADTGLDVLTHAIEGYAGTWHNDFCDGMCLQAAKLVFQHLVEAVENGKVNLEARERMINAAAIAGLGFGNANAALAHAMGHSLGAYFKQPHGRVVGLLLPYTVEYCLRGDTETRYGDLARFAGLTQSQDEMEAGTILVQAIRALAERIGQPASIADLGIDRAAFDAGMHTLIEHAEGDTQIVTSTRVPDGEELQQLFDYAFEGKPIDF